MCYSGLGGGGGQGAACTVRRKKAIKIHSKVLKSPRILFALHLAPKAGMQIQAFSTSTKPSPALLYPSPPLLCRASQERVLPLHSRRLDTSTSHVFSSPSSYFTTVSWLICKAATVKSRSRKACHGCLGYEDVIFLSTLWRSFAAKQLKHTRLNQDD